MSERGRLNEQDFTRIVREIQRRQQLRERQSDALVVVKGFGGQSDAISNPGEGSESIDTASSIRRTQLIVPNNSSADVTLGTTAGTGHAELFYQFKRGSLRGAGRLRLWHDGATVSVANIDFSGDLPGENTAIGSVGWTAAIVGSDVVLTWASDNSGNATTFNLAYIVTEAL